LKTDGGYPRDAGVFLSFTMANPGSSLHFNTHFLCWFWLCCPVLFFNGVFLCPIFLNFFKFPKLLVVVVFFALSVFGVFFCQIFTSCALFVMICFQFGCPSCAHSRLSLVRGRLGIQSCTHPLLLTKCSQLSCRAWGRGARGKRRGFSPEAAVRQTPSARVTLTVPNLSFSKKNSARVSQTVPDPFFPKHLGWARDFIHVALNFFVSISKFRAVFVWSMSSIHADSFRTITIFILFSFNHFQIYLSIFQIISRCNAPVFSLSEFHSFLSRYLFPIFFDILIVQKWHTNVFAKYLVLPKILVLFFDQSQISRPDFCALFFQNLMSFFRSFAHWQFFHYFHNLKPSFYLSPTFVAFAF